MREFIKDKRYIFFLLVILLFLSIINIHYSVHDVLLTQDEYGVFNGGINYVKNGNLIMPNFLGDQYNIGYSDYRVYKDSNLVFFSGFPYSSIFYGIYYTYFDDSFYVIIFLSYIFFYLTLNNLLRGVFFKKYLSLFISFIIATFPLFVFYFTSFFNNNISLFLLSVIIFLFSKYFDDYKLKYLILTLFLGLVLLLIRLPIGLFTLIAIFLFSKGFHHRFYSVIFLIFGIFNIFLINKIAYGSFTYMPYLNPFPYIPFAGYGVKNPVEDRNFIVSGISYILGSSYGLMGFDFFSVLSHLFYHLKIIFLNSFTSLIYIITFFLWFLTYRKQEGKIKRILIFMLIIGLFLVYFYGNRGNYFGYGDVAINVNYFRYIMIIFIPIIIGSFYYLYKKVNKKAFFIIFLFLFFTNLCIIDSSLSKLNSYRNTVQEVNNFITENFELEKTIFITGYYTGKYLYGLNLNSIENQIKNISLTYYGKSNKKVVTDSYDSQLEKIIKEFNYFSFIYIRRIVNEVRINKEEDIIFNNFNYQEIGNINGIIFYNITKY